MEIEEAIGAEPVFVAALSEAPPRPLEFVDAVLQTPIDPVVGPWAVRSLLNYKVEIQQGE